MSLLLRHEDNAPKLLSSSSSCGAHKSSCSAKNPKDPLFESPFATLTGRWWPQRRRLRRRRRLHRCLGLFYFICYVFSVLPLWVFDFLLLFFCFFLGWLAPAVFLCRRRFRLSSALETARLYEK